MFIMVVQAELLFIKRETMIQCQSYQTKNNDKELLLLSALNKYILIIIFGFGFFF
jgi:hypothetical protein